MVILNQVTPIAIDQLPPATTITGNEITAVVQNGQTVQTPVSSYAQGISAGVITYGVSGGAPFPNYRTLDAGSNITITDGGPQGSLTISAATAPTNASYVVISADASLTAERVLAVGSSLSLTDGGANGNVTIGTQALSGDVTASANSFVTTLATVNSNVGSFTNANITVDAKGRITAASNGSGGGGSGTVTSVSVTTANGVSGSVATPTTTPAITLTLGAITPSSVAASGTVTGSNLSGTNTGDQTSVTGNAGTATALQTGRAIGITGTTGLTATGVSFNGTAAINLTLTGTLAIANGGTGQTTATAAFDALAPSQTGNSGKFLTTNGTTTSWATASGSGSVTTVSVVSANGLAGSVANATTTPAITLSTSVTGVLKGNGTAISAATANTDYQAPISLTTTGTSGASTFVGNTLNIPQYTGGGGSSSAVTISITQASHGFTAGQVLRYNGTSYVLAQANNGTNQEVVGIVSAVTNTNVFVMTTEGYIASGLTVTAGENFLSPTSAGALTTTAPTTAGQINKPIFFADTTSSGYFHNYRGMSVASATSQTRAIGVTIGAIGGSAITTGLKAYQQIPYACTINSVTMGTEQTGSIVVDIWKDTYANYPPTVADTITASALPTISASNKSQDLTLTGWNKTVNAGDWLAFNVNSASTVAYLNLTLSVTPT